LLIKYIKSVLWRVVKRLSYIEEARCLKVKVCLRDAPRFKWLVASLPSRSPGLDRRSVPVRFVVDKVELGQISLRVVLLSAVNTIPPTLHIHIHPHVVLTRRAKRRGLGTNLPKKQCSPVDRGELDGRVLSLSSV